MKRSCNKTMSKQMSILTVLLVSMFFSQCSKSNFDNSESVLNETIFVSSEYVNALDSLVEFKIKLETERTFACYNFIIDTVFKTELDTLKITALDIKSPKNICATAIGPALITIELELNKGSYPIVFLDAATRGEFKLRVNENEVSILQNAIPPKSSNFISLD